MFLGLDFGTSGARACAMDDAKSVVWKEHVAYPDAASQTPLDWRSALHGLLHALPKDIAAGLSGIAIDGTSGTVMLCNAELEPLHPALLYHDDRALQQAEQLKAITSDNHTVCTATSGLAKFLWLTQHSDCTRAAYFLHQGDWLTALLSGQSGISDYHNALKTGYDVELLRWPDWVTALPHSQLLPNVHRPGSCIGHIQPEIAAHFGINPQCAIHAGTTDSIAAFIATGVDETGVGVTSLGTTLVLKQLSERRIDAPEYGVYSHRYGDQWLVGGASNAGAGVLRRYFSDAQLATLSDQIDPMQDSPLDYYPLNKIGERFPVNDAELAPRLQPRPGNDVAFLHGLLQGLARIELAGYQKLAELGAPKLKRVITNGGGAENTIWKKMRERLLMVPVDMAEHREAAYGSALLCSNSHRENGGQLRRNDTQGSFPSSPLLLQLIDRHPCSGYNPALTTSSVSGATVMLNNLFNSRLSFNPGKGKTGTLYSLPALEAAGIAKISRLPVSIRIVLESVLRNCDGKKVTEQHVRQLANWQPNAARTEEIPFVVARIILQDFTGVPLLADLAAMRSVANGMGKNPKLIEPLVPVDLVVDHSVQVDYYGNKSALDLNMKMEFQRNQERYQFMKWGMQAFDTFKVVPPGIGIVHQVNLEYLARGVHKSKDGVYYPDTLVGTDSHTTMINGIGVVGWGVGGIEAEAGMLGQPVFFLTPDVVGVNLKGKLHPACTATDLVLTVTEMLRKAKVVGKFVEFFGAGTASLNVTDRATIANMAPEYGATMGFFPVDDKTLDYFEGTGRTEDEIEAFAAYFKAQGMFGIPKAGDIDYSQTLELDLSTVMPSLAGPKRPQDRINLDQVKATFTTLFTKPVAENGFAKKPEELAKSYKTSDGTAIRNGDVLIAAITSCTNTSNPGVLLAAGLLAKKAVELGLRVSPHIKTSLAPGSRVVTEYLTKAGLLPYLEKLGFYLAGYGCTTCIGNAGPLAQPIEEAIVNNDLICAAVLSGNRNFEARIHPNIRANFLASPPLVVAYAIAGTMLKDFRTEPLGKSKDGRDIYIGDIWPTHDEVQALMKLAMDGPTFRRLYSNLAEATPLWKKISAPSGQVYDWPKSTYIAEPPFFRDFSMQPARIGNVSGARTLCIFGDSVTTDHISPAGSIKPTSPAGRYLQDHNVAVSDFNSYGSRRGNHEVMMRGTFANVRIKNLMLPPNADRSRIEGGYTLYQGRQMPIYEAAMNYIAAGIPTVIFAGEEYGTGSSRDWAAKGTQLLGVKAVIAKSYERIHRSNLVGMGVLPLQFKGDTNVAALHLTGEESFDIGDIDNNLKPQQDVTLTIHRKDGSRQTVSLLLRIDTPIEVDYYRHGGILPYVLRELVSQ